MRSNLILTTLAVWLSLTGATAAQGVDPNLVGWGADLPMPPNQEYLHGGVYEDPDGNVIVGYTTYVGQQDSYRYQGQFYNVLKDAVLSTFSESTDDHPSRDTANGREYEYKRLLRLRELPYISDWYGFVSGIEPDHPRDRNGNVYGRVEQDACLPLFASLRKFDAQGRRVFDLVLVRLLKAPKVTGGDCGFEERLVSLHRVHSVNPILYELRDGTFLLQDFKSPLIVRFRGDFTSPFIDASDDLALIDADLFRTWIDTCDEEARTARYLLDTAAREERDVYSYGRLMSIEQIQACLAMRVSRLIGERIGRRGIP